ncbi:GNAT family N-acetyltransferase [Telluribacter humicola]|uniref:GNAT family N-acetyltransferase n=1 Tax=Telluribacter humicola TaxID=1720261 RepID=UPI001A977E42|nr:GNAT family N-acetyltransferase [Telluribacter humicola]
MLLKNYSEANLKDIQALKADPLVWQYATTKATDSLLDTRVYLDGVLAKYATKQYAFQALYAKASGQFVGEAGILAFNAENRKAVIGYNLLPSYWQQGYATEIVKALISHLFETMEVERIEALTVEDNRASRKVLEKGGFLLEGLMRNYACIHSRFVNVCMYAIIKSDYDSAVVDDNINNGKTILP